jgi:hypothetical protein
MRQQTAAVIGGAGAGAALLVVLGLVVLQSGGTSCTASLARESVPIRLSGDVSAVRGIEGCLRASCTLEGSPTESPTPNADGSEPIGAGAAAASSSKPVFAARVSAATWDLLTSGSEPGHVSIIVRGAGGRILVTKSFELRWSQVGATSPCGNPHTVPAVHLVVPAQR